MHYRHNEFQNFVQNLALDAHDALHRKSTLAFIRHCSRVGGGWGDDKLAIDKGGNLPEKVENHCYRGFNEPTAYSETFKRNLRRLHWANRLAEVDFQRPTCLSGRTCPDS